MSIGAPRNSPPNGGSMPECTTFYRKSLQIPPERKIEIPINNINAAGVVDFNDLIINADLVVTAYWEVKNPTAFSDETGEYTSSSINIDVIR